MNSVEKTIAKIVEGLLNVESSFNDLEANLINKGLDSIKVVKLIVMLEEAFEIEFEDDELQMRNFISVKTIANLIIKKEDKKDENTSTC